MKTLHGAFLSLLVLFAIPSLSFGEGPKFKAEPTGTEEALPVTAGEAEFKVIAHDAAIKFELEIDNGINSLAIAGAHIHCALADQRDPIVVYLAGKMPGGFDGEITIEAIFSTANIVNPACGATIPALIASIQAGNTYVDVHSPAYPGGAIRGSIKTDPSQGAVCSTSQGPACPKGQYCDIGVGRCDIPKAQGTCKIKPEVCFMIYNPVCGCNGKTYSNACMAAAAGVSIAHPGKCGPSKP